MYTNMDIHAKAKKIIGHFERILTPSVEETIEPSSWWNDSMVMLEEDSEIPLELRLYCGWMPYKERKHKEWYFFPPHHVFRLPEENEYLLAQHPLKLLMYSFLQKKWRIVSRTDSQSQSANCFSEIAVYL